MIKRKVIGNREQFGFARNLIRLYLHLDDVPLILYPPAVYGEYQLVISEIVSANIILYTTSIIVIVAERHFEQIQYSKEFKFILIIMCIIAMSLYVIYTYKDPWFDVFAIPPGWE